MFQIRLQKDNLPTPQDGVLLTIILAVGISSIMEDAAVNVIHKLRKSVADLANQMYNDIDGAEIDSILLEDYLGN